jgi:chromosome segregation ATPase
MDKDDIRRLMEQGKKELAELREIERQVREMNAELIRLMKMHSKKTDERSKIHKDLDALIKRQRWITENFDREINRGRVAEIRKEKEEVEKELAERQQQSKQLADELRKLEVQIDALSAKREQIFEKIKP